MPQKKAFVLGGYGFIGHACMKALENADYDVTGIGRSGTAAKARGGKWHILDIAQTDAATWANLLQDADLLVNAAGALQDGSKDSLKAIHEDAITAITTALAGRQTRFIQISAAGATLKANTEFMRSKARGDAILQSSSLTWTILRPALVLGPEAYGGTALLRASAAMPLIGLIALPNAQIQTIHVEDLANAVVQSADAAFAQNASFDLSESGSHTLRDVTKAIRAWQGFPPWRKILALPKAILKPISKIADALGWLGWRSPLRTNALTSLENGVTAIPGDWSAQGGLPLRSLSQTLQSLPSSSQERLFARAYLLLPLIIATLSLFWITSGLIGAAQWQAAKALLTTRGTPETLASLAVFGGAVLDITLGAAILWRKHSKRACLGMIALSLAYMTGAAITAPDLWIDPLGPMVKTIPATMLALIPLALMDHR